MVKRKHWPSRVAAYPPGYSFVKRCPHGKLKIILLLPAGQAKSTQRTENGTNEAQICIQFIWLSKHGLFVLCRLLTVRALWPFRVEFN